MSDDVRALLRRGAGEEAGPPDLQHLQREVRRRRRRRVAAAAGATAVLVVAVAVGSTQLLRGGPPAPIVEQPESAASATPTPGPPTDHVVDGWRRLPSPPTLVGPGAQAPTTALASQGGVLMAGLDAATSDVLPTLWRQADGGAWSASALEVDDADAGPQDAAARVLDLAAGTAAVVGVGAVETGSGDTPVAWRSTDGGRSWASNRPPGSPTGAMTSVTWTGDRFVAVGGAAGPTVWTSSDGAAWAIRRLAEEGDLVDVVVFGDLLLAVEVIGDSSAIWTGDVAGDPAAWSRTEIPGDMTLASLAVTPDAAYAIGAARPDGLDHDGVLLTSEDGRTWIRDPRSASLGGPGEQLPRAILVTTAGALLVAGDDDGAGRLWTSDGPETPFTVTATSLFEPGSGIVGLLSTPAGPLAYGVVETDDDTDLALWLNADPSG